MSHFAKIENLLVTAVIVAEQPFVDTLNGLWVKTSYNTRGGIHYGPDGLPDGAPALRANFAGIGFTYDKVRDVFYAPKPSPLHELNDLTYLWELKAEYEPLAIVKVTSTALTIPIGAVGDSIEVNGVSVGDKTLVFFPTVQTNPGVYRYSTESSPPSFSFVDFSNYTIKTFGDDSQVWKFIDNVWTGIAVPPT